VDFDIIDLADAPDLVDTCAAWSFGMWGCQSDGSLAKAQAGFASAATPAREAFTFVARHGGKTAGMASLRASDFKGRPDLTPWLSSVYVHPDHRRVGLARALVQRVESQAREQGHERLYLISEHAETLYADLGWTTFDHVIGSHGPAVLMTKGLT
jgi:GNAT superfamily N-acetyltransferase